MKNFIIVVLAGVVAFLLLALLYMSRKDIVAEFEGLGNMSYALAREKAAARNDANPKSEIKIALIGDWEYDRFKSVHKGAKLAVSELNAAGGINGHRVTLIVRNTEGKVTRSKELAQALAADVNVAALISGFTYMEFSAIAPICEFNKLPLISPIITSGLITDQAALKMVFTNYPDIDTILGVMYRFLKKNNLKSTVIISPSQYHYGNYFANAFDAGLGRDSMGLCGVIKRDICYEYTPFQMRKYFESLDSSKAYCDNMLICGGREIVRPAMALAREYGNNVVYLLTDELEVNELSDKISPELKVFLPSVYDLSSEKEANKHFKAKYLETYSIQPDVWAAQGYDTMNVLAAGIREGKSSRPDKIADSLFKIKFYGNVSTAPYIDFGSDGILDSSMPVLKYPVRGGFKVLKDLDIKDRKFDPEK